MTTAVTPEHLSSINLSNLAQGMEPPSNWLLSRVAQSPWPFPSATWDYIHASADGGLQLSQLSGRFIYLREKRVFEPTTLYWLRTTGPEAEANAKAAVTKEVGDLNLKFDQFAELVLWLSLTGRIKLDFPDIKSTVNYRFSPSHLPSVKKPWQDAEYNEILDEVESWGKIIRQDGRVTPQEVFLHRSTMLRIISAYKRADIEDLEDDRLITREMREEFKAKGVMPDLLNMTWRVIPVVSSSLVGFGASVIPDGAFFMGDYTTNRPLELLVGPCGDDEAPAGYTGKFVKSWKEVDPSTRQFLMEWSFVPIITRPGQMMYCHDVNSVKLSPKHFCEACNRPFDDEDS